MTATKIECDRCMQLFLKEQLISHTADTGGYRQLKRVLVIDGQRIDSIRDMKVSRLCWVCDGLAKQRDERLLAGYTDPPRGDEHYFYDVPWRR